ncbi:MAG: hypothetical protein ACRYGK_14895 [Janthinobacterium lividum]
MDRLSSAQIHAFPGTFENDADEEQLEPPVLPITPHTNVLDLHKFLANEKDDNFLGVQVPEQSRIPQLHFYPNEQRPSLEANHAVAMQIGSILNNGRGLPWPKGWKLECTHALGRLVECRVAPVLKAVTPIAQVEHQRQQQRNVYCAYWENSQSQLLENLQPTGFRAIRKVLANLPAGFDADTDPHSLQQSLSATLAEIGSFIEVQILCQTLDEIMAAPDMVDGGQKFMLQAMQICAGLMVAREKASARADNANLHHVQDTAELKFMNALFIAIAANHGVSVTRQLPRNSPNTTPTRAPAPHVDRRSFAAGVSRQLFRDDDASGLDSRVDSIDDANADAGIDDSAGANHSALLIEVVPPKPQASAGKKKSRRERASHQSVSHPATTPTKHRSHEGLDHGSEHNRNNGSGRGHHKSGKTPSERRKPDNEHQPSEAALTVSLAYAQQHPGSINELDRLYACAPLGLKQHVSKPQSRSLVTFFRDLGPVDLQNISMGEMNANLAAALKAGSFVGEELSGVHSTLNKLLDATHAQYFDAPAIKPLRPMLRSLRLAVAQLLSNADHQHTPTNTSDSRSRAVTNDSSGHDSSDSNSSRRRRASPRSPSYRALTSQEDGTPPDSGKRRGKPNGKTTQ